MVPVLVVLLATLPADSTDVRPDEVVWIVDAPGPGRVVQPSSRNSVAAEPIDFRSKRKWARHQQRGS